MKWPKKKLLEGDKFISEMHLKQPKFTYSACGPFKKTTKEYKIFEQTGDSRYIYKNELGKTCFQHDKAYRDFKDLARRTASDKILRDKVFNLKQLKEDLIYSMIYNFFDKKHSGRGIKNKTK